MSSRTRIPLFLGASLAVVVAAFVITRPTPSADQAAPARTLPILTTVVGPEPVGPASQHRGVSVGWSRDGAGATAAAIDRVRSIETIATAGPLERSDLIAVLATQRFRELLTASTNRQLDDLLFSLGGRGYAPSDLTWLEYPLTVNVDADTADAATVEVWSVSVVMVEGGSVARQMWHTDTLSLVWQDGDWKVDGWDSTPGPTPGLGSEVELSNLADVDAVGGWQPASGSETSR